MFIKNSLTLEEATEAWVAQFNEINQAVIARLMKYEPDKWREITLPAVSDTVFVCKADSLGEIIEYEEESGDYRIRLVNGEKIYARPSDFEVEYDERLPMWSAMWSFDNSFDERWLKEWGGLEVMSNLGFRIYEHEDFGCYFGIDGAGYDFYKAHWIPLYIARGLEWHKEG